MSKPLKVWGGLTYTAKKASPNGSREARTIVCAPSQRKAVELLGAVPGNRCYVSLYYFREYWAETGNQKELEIACKPGVWTSQVAGWEKADWKQLWPYDEETCSLFPA